MEKSPIESSDPSKERSPAEIVQDIENNVPRYEHPTIHGLHRQKTLTPAKKVAAFGIAALVVATAAGVLYLTAPGGKQEKHEQKTPSVKAPKE